MRPRGNYKEKLAYDLAIAAATLQYSREWVSSDEFNYIEFVALFSDAHDEFLKLFNVND